MEASLFLREMKDTMAVFGIANGTNLTFKSFCWGRYVDEDEVLDVVLNPCESLDRVIHDSSSGGDGD